MNFEMDRPSVTRRVVREDIEWCDVWIPHLNEHGLPRVLLIGDSITRAYYQKVERILEGQAFVGRLTTSRSVGDPALIGEVSAVLSQTKFDVIHFNNGMHGWGYSEEEYETYFPEFLESIRQNALEARLIWASTTPVRTAHKLDEFHARTQRVELRNTIAACYVQARGIPVNDLCALAKIEHYTDDGVHFNTTGSDFQAKHVASSISTVLW